MICISPARACLCRPDIVSLIFKQNRPDECMHECRLKNRVAIGAQCKPSMRAPPQRRLPMRAPPQPHPTIVIRRRRHCLERNARVHSSRTVPTYAINASSTATSSPSASTTTTPSHYCQSSPLPPLGQHRDTSMNVPNQDSPYEPTAR